MWKENSCRQAEKTSISSLEYAECPRTWWERDYKFRHILTSHIFALKSFTENRFWPYPRMFKHLSFHPKSLQPCLTLRNPMDLSPQGSSVHGFLQAGILEWVAISLSKDLPNLGIKALSIRSPALAVRFLLLFFTTSTTWEAQHIKKLSKYLGWLRSRPSVELLIMMFKTPIIQPGP